MRFALCAAASVLAFAPAVVLAHGHQPGHHHPGPPPGATPLQPGGAPFAGPPMDARAGQCFARVLIPAEYATEAQTVTVQDGYERIEVSQPQFRTGSQNVVVRDEYKRYQVTEPQFRTEQATITTRPAFERLVVEPAQFASQPRAVTIREPRLVWRRGTDLSGVRRIDPQTGDVFCLVEEPGQTQAYSYRALTRPETVRRETVPAQVQTVTRQVLVRPATVQEVVVPAEVRSVAVHELVAPAAERRVAVEPRLGTFNRQVMTAPERYEWVPVVCETQMTGGLNSRIQQALAQRGLYRGPIDGIVGPMTRDALSRFQRAERIPGGGQVTTETLSRLGVR